MNLEQQAEWLLVIAAIMIGKGYLALSISWESKNSGIWQRRRYYAFILGATAIVVGTLLPIVFTSNQAVMEALEMGRAKASWYGWLINIFYIAGLAGVVVLPLSIWRIHTRPALWHTNPVGAKPMLTIERQRHQA
jgi:MFS family permease